MKMNEYLLMLIESKGFSIRSFAAHIGVPYTTLHSMLRRDIKNASVETVIRICKGLGITVEQLCEVETQPVSAAGMCDIWEAYNSQPELQHAVRRILDLPDKGC